MNDYISKNTYFLLRHGEADHNVANVLSDAAHDKTNPSHLTENGKEQIAEVAEELKTDKIDYIYASPLTRTMETASIVAKKIGVEIIKDNRLREVENGVLSGHPIAEYNNYNSDEDKLNRAPEGGESLNHVRARAQEFIDEIHGTYNKKNILLVSHGDTTWMIEAILEGFEGEEVFDMPYIEPGELRVLGN